MTGDLWRLEASELARLIRLGRASSREATQSCLARLEAVNPALNAVVRVLAAEALAAADAADEARARGDVLGPLHGVPVTTKANTDQAGCPTDNGVVAYRDLIASEDSPVVANLKRAGAVMIGRTNTPAFSMRAFADNALHGRTLNPRDPTLSAGGSSGGAGAAVAVGIGAIAQGNDIAGSVRIPALYNGVVGLRVSLGRIPSYNPSQPTARPIGAQLMAVQGPLVRSVRDARLALKAMAQGDPRDTRWVDAPLAGPPVPRPIRVALVARNPGGFTHPAQAEAVRRAGRHLAAAGYAVEEVAPPDLDEIVATWHRIGSTDVLRVLAPLVEELGDADARASMRLWLELVPPTDLDGVLTALAQRDLFLWRWLDFMRHHPLVVLPTMGDLAPPHNLDTTREGQARMLDSIRVGLISPVLGVPALAVPVGRHGPLRPGVQILAPRLREDLCLEAGEVIEAAEGVVAPIDPVAAPAADRR
ncbi:MAG TPA: amidase [Stellaceae bacterium]|nr:amidase [Stellaceae bacterium]